MENSIAFHFAATAMTSSVYCHFAVVFLLILCDAGAFGSRFMSIVPLSFIFVRFPNENGIKRKKTRVKISKYYLLFVRYTQCIYILLYDFLPSLARSFAS